jgi:hypothetical protein
MTYSKDEGGTWGKPLLLSSRGNLMSAAIDDRGAIHCIYSDYTDRQYEVRYKRFGDGYEVLDDRLLRKSGPLNTREYIGAYQKLLVQKENLYAFWIDYSGNTTLNFARWIMRSPIRRARGALSTLQFRSAAEANPRAWSVATPLRPRSIARQPAPPAL